MKVLEFDGLKENHHANCQIKINGNIFTYTV